MGKCTLFLILLFSVTVFAQEPPQPKLEPTLAAPKTPPVPPVRPGLTQDDVANSVGQLYLLVQQITKEKTRLEAETRELHRQLDEKHAKCEKKDKEKDKPQTTP